MIKDTVTLYLKKDKYGDYRIPVVRQRPIFMVGAPGIGKTAIMEQISSELGISLVSYSMTHHTRQSALGLPYITKKRFGNEEFSMTEYTMSEIIASVYEAIDKTDIKEGILFLDEINCVSETLGPPMLQFLQYKTFGRHALPNGWVIVTAGNPPEYNRSVREFDVATLDRMKVISVEPDLKAWREYAYGRNIHSAITGYLESKKDDFYVMEMSPEGRAYVTARGWEDLSQILRLSEEEGIECDETLVSQYLRCERVSKDFSAYYDMFRKYRKDYRIEDILAGNPPEGIMERAGASGFDERLSIVSMLMDSVSTDARDVMEKADALKMLTPLVRSAIDKDDNNVDGILKLFNGGLESQKKNLGYLKAHDRLTSSQKKIIHDSIKLYEGFIEYIRMEIRTTTSNALSLGKKLSWHYEFVLNDLKKDAEGVSVRLSNMIGFVRKAYEGGNEPVILATKLTSDPWTSRFIATFGSTDYDELAKDMELSERGNDLKDKVMKLEL